MYSRRRGKASSTKPSQKKQRTWMSYKSKEIELLTLKLAKEGRNPSEIGMILRDTYGIPSVKEICKKNITQVMREKNLLKQVPEDLTSLIKRAIAIRKHTTSNHKDMTAKRGLQLTESKINRLVKYYKRTERLPADWKYDPKKASLRVS